jgi:hypothetical protein
VIIDIAANLTAFDMGGALGLQTDADTGAMLTIARPNVVIDGNGHTIRPYGYPAFHVEGLVED